ncbi:MAG TPA: hypothetical protein VIF83_09460 [Gemmatimonadaceae bacterium]|jgi:hypothetical protein
MTAIGVSGLVSPSIVAAQAEKKGKTPEEIAAAMARAVAKSKESEGFYSSIDPLVVTLTTNIKRIRGDKSEKAPWRSATLSYTDAAGKSVVIPTRIRTRGIWRLKNCEMPPIRLDFQKAQTAGTVFQGIDKPKLVNYCRDNDTFEQYIAQEAQLYRVYNLLTPASHRARLVKVNYVDSATGKTLASRAAIILEEPDIVAARLGGPILKLKGAVADNLDPHHDALLGVFNYMIGNTDFSIAGLHNVELVGLPDGMAVPIPFDFDFAGAVDTRYATADPKLEIARVRQRLFRGYCVPAEEYTKVFDLFKAKKDAIYGLYTDPIGKMLQPKLVEETLKYFDEFYKTISDPRRAKNEIIENCLHTG